MKTEDRGRSVRRFQDFRFLTGVDRYVGDFSLPGQVHAHMLRSAYAHGDRLYVGADRRINVFAF
ncbi:MAG TPA: hypothetical protein VHT21_09735 [Stellaceae bacterium]|nr:hypothetical protein [Stellaceae bacterium]